MLRGLHCWALPALVLGLACSATAAHHAKAPAATDRSQADADYAVQGEYVGKAVTSSGREFPAGAQVVALGHGKFQAVLYEGGLPGAGWSREDGKAEVSGQREGDVVKLAGGEFEVTIAGDLLTVTHTAGEGEAKLHHTERKSPTLGAKPPQGALVLFDGTSTEHFTEGRINKKAGTLWSGATTKPVPLDYTLHLEFLLPYMPESRGQGRANSGVYLHDCYEVQVLDSFGLEGADNECGGIYHVRRPDVNMCLPPLVWQTYDIEFTAPRYDTGGKKTAPARATIRHNGVVIHDNIELKHTPGRQAEGPGPRAIHLQQHGNKVQYRNVWLVAK